MLEKYYSSQSTRQVGNAKKRVVVFWFFFFIQSTMYTICFLGGGKH